MAEKKGSLLAKSVQKHAGRAKEKVCDCDNIKVTITEQQIKKKNNNNNHLSCEYKEKMINQNHDFCCKWKNKKFKR